MSAFLFDVDGTVLRYHTSEWLPGVIEAIEQLHAKGNQVMFVTMRGPQDAGTEWSVEKTEAALSKLSFRAPLLTGIASPRIIVDDSGPVAIQALTNSPIWVAQVRG